jgi:hypothetical protein
VGVDWGSVVSAACWVCEATGADSGLSFRRPMKPRSATPVTIAIVFGFHISLAPQGLSC